MLNEPIAELGMSKKFTSRSKKYGYRTLADILQLDKPYELLQHKGFDMVLLMEFTQILSTNGLSKYLMPLNGVNH